MTYLYKARFTSRHTRTERSEIGARSGWVVVSLAAAPAVTATLCRWAQSSAQQTSFLGQELFVERLAHTVSSSAMPGTGRIPKAQGRQSMSGEGAANDQVRVFRQKANHLAILILKIFPKSSTAAPCSGIAPETFEELLSKQVPVSLFTGLAR